MSKIIHVMFFEPQPDGETHFYFGSVAAIFDFFTPVEIGCRVKTVYHHLRGGNCITSKCFIRLGVLQRKKITKKKNA